MGTRLTPGLRIGDRYELVEPVDDYGIGEAWRAKKTSGRAQPVVIKLLRELASPDLASAFESHLKYLRALRHGNVLAVLDGGLFEARPYVVHPLSPGRSLAAGLPQRDEDPPLPPAITEAFFTRILAGLIVAHSAASLPHGAVDARSVLIHRVGPQNFELRVLDFGLASWANWTAGQRDYHALTRRRAPELSPHDSPTEASEVFTVGELMRVLFGRPRAFDSVRDDMPPAVWEVVRRATAPRPDDRYATIEQLYEAFRGAWDAPHSKTPPAAPTEPRQEASAATLVDDEATVLSVHEDATVITPPRRNPPPVMAFPAVVRERKVDPYAGMTPLALPPLQKPSPDADTTVVDTLISEDTTVRIRGPVAAQSFWDTPRQHTMLVQQPRPVTRGALPDEAGHHTVPALPPAEALRTVPVRSVIVPQPKPVAIVSREEEAEERRLRKMLWATATGVAVVLAALVTVLARR